MISAVSTIHAGRAGQGIDLLSPASTLGGDDSGTDEIDLVGHQDDGRARNGLLRLLGSSSAGRVVAPEELQNALRFGSAVQVHHAAQRQKGSDGKSSVDSNWTGKKQSHE